MKKEKGFTIVELMVVIVILSVLSVVSIVSYNTFIKKAHVSNDITYVTQMNNVLNGTRITENKNDSMSEALNDVFDSNFNELDIQTNGYNIAWSKKNDLFVLLDKNNEIVFPSNINKENNDLFLLVDDVSTINNSNEFIYCLSNKYNSDTLTTNLNVDIGLNKNIKRIEVNLLPSITYLYTNNNELVINVKDQENVNSSITHYGIANSLNIDIDIKNTYIEKGSLLSSIDKVTITSGKLIVEDIAKVDSMYVNASRKENVNIKIPYRNFVAFVDDINILDDSNINKHDKLLIKLRNTVATNIVIKKDYTNIEDAINDGGSIILLKNVKLIDNKTLFINKPITIDFYGHSILGMNKCYNNTDIGIIWVKCKDVIFNDSSTTNKGKVINEYATGSFDYYCTIYIGSKNELDSNEYSLTINDRITIEANCKSSICTGYGKCNLYLNNCNIKSEHDGINLENTNDDSVLKVKESNFNCKEKNVVSNKTDLDISKTKFAYGKNNKMDNIYNLIEDKHISLYKDYYFVDDNTPTDFIAVNNCLNNNFYLIEGSLENLIEINSEKDNSIEISVQKDCNINLVRFGNDNGTEKELKVNVLNKAIISGTISLRIAIVHINYYNEKLEIKAEGGYKIEKNDNGIIRCNKTSK